MDNKPHAAAQEDASQQPLIDVGRIERQVKASSLKKVGQLIDAHPEEALVIVRSWMYQGS